MRFSTEQVKKILQNDDQTYIRHNELGNSTVFNGCGDELGEITPIVFKRLKIMQCIELVAECDLFWSRGYFKWSASASR